MRVIVHSVPGVEAVGNHVLRLAGGFHADRGVNEPRGPRRHDRLRRGHLADSVDSYPGQHAVLEDGQRPPRAVGLSAERQAVPRADETITAHATFRQRGAHVRAGIRTCDQLPAGAPEHEITTGDPVAVRAVVEAATRIHDVPASARAGQRMLQRLADPARTRLLPVRLGGYHRSRRK